MVQNELVVTHTLNHLGTRVGVATLEVHVESFYALMNIPIPRDSTHFLDTTDTIFCLVLFIVCPR